MQPVIAVISFSMYHCVAIMLLCRWCTSHERLLYSRPNDARYGTDVCRANQEKNIFLFLSIPCYKKSISCANLVWIFVQSSDIRPLYISLLS